MPHKGFKRNSKSKDKFCLLAEEVVRIYGSASTGVIFDYVKDQHRSNQKWMPMKSSVSSWLSSSDKFYRGSDGEWRLRPIRA